MALYLVSDGTLHCNNYYTTVFENTLATCHMAFTCTHNHNYIHLHVHTCTYITAYWLCT